MKIEESSDAIQIYSLGAWQSQGVTLDVLLNDE